MEGRPFGAAPRPRAGDKVRAEAHICEEGDHGFGLYLARGKPAAAWPDLFLAWAGRHG